MAVMLAASAALTVAWANGADRARVDVDGDGVRDTVSLTRHARSFVLRVDTGARVITKTVRGFSSAMATAQGEPRLAALRPINDRRGFEIAVRVWHSASRDFLVFYTVDRGRIVALTGGPPAPSWPPTVWEVGGSLGTGTSTVDCIGRARIGVLDAWTSPGAWHYRLTTYDARAARFVKRGVYELVSQNVITRLPGDWPRVKRDEFESCGGGIVP